MPIPPNRDTHNRHLKNLDRRDGFGSASVLCFCRNRYLAEVDRNPEGLLFKVEQKRMKHAHVVLRSVFLFKSSKYPAVPQPFFAV